VKRRRMPCAARPRERLDRYNEGRRMEYSRSRRKLGKDRPYHPQVPGPARRPTDRGARGVSVSSSPASLCAQPRRRTSLDALLAAVDVGRHP